MSWHPFSHGRSRATRSYPDEGRRSEACRQATIRALRRAGPPLLFVVVALLSFAAFSQALMQAPRENAPAALAVGVVLVLAAGIALGLTLAPRQASQPSQCGAATDPADPPAPHARRVRAGGPPPKNCHTCRRRAGPT